MSSDHVIEIQGLAHAYNGRPALVDLHFSISRGEIFGLLGPNGSGKTTLFRILSTLLVPTSGDARIFGMSVRLNPGGVRQRIGVVFQSPSVDGKLTTSENLRHQGHLYGLRGKVLRERMSDVLERFSLSDRAHDRVETLSGGLRRRVEIAKAMLHRPGLLLLDEPSTGLDPGARHDLWTYLEAVRAESGFESSSTTIVFTTHLMEEAERCERVGIMDRGTLVALDTPAALKAQIGGDAITVQSREPERLCQSLRQRFGGEPTVIGDTVRVERQSGHTFIAELVEAFPGLISSVMVRRPTLEDVFIQRTGHRFDT